jgi:hypothetical protein
MQYILTRSQASFLEDVQDWMKGRIIESQAIDTMEETGDIRGLARVSSSGGGGSDMSSAGFIDIFVDSLGDFTEKMERSNQISQDMFGKIAEKIEQTVNRTDNESILLKNLIEVMKESNVNQYSSSKLIEESLQEISTVILSEHKTIKKSLLVQEENNKLLVELINKLESKR